MGFSMNVMDIDKMIVLLDQIIVSIEAKRDFIIDSVDLYDF